MLLPTNGVGGWDYYVYAGWVGGHYCTYSTLTEGPNVMLWDLYPQARSDA